MKRRKVDNKTQPAPSRTVLVCTTAAVLVTSCAPTSPTTKTTTYTHTLTRSAAAAPRVFRLARIAVPPRPPDRALPRGEVDGRCPYIKAGKNIEPDPTGDNFADLEGNRVQRVTRLTTLKPIGCRFYFQGDYHPTGDILPSTYSSPSEAHNAMVATAEAGTSAHGIPSFLPGVDGISFRTRLNPPDGDHDWAFAFARGNVMVVVRTDQNASLPANAELIAKSIARYFN